MKTSVKSHHSNWYAQIYAHQNQWCKAYLMKQKGDADEMLSLLFAHDSVCNTLIKDGSGEQTMVEFRIKARQADCHIKQMEPYSPCQNAAEHAIKELKKGTTQKMIKSNLPRVLWDDCLQMEAEIQSSMVNNVYELYWEVPKSKMSGETANITHISKFGWYDWVYFKDNAITYLNDKWVGLVAWTKH